MGWRPNLAHSQYYLNRASNGEASSGASNKSHQPAYQQQQHNPSQGLQSQHGVEFESMMAAPISAPPFGSVPMNPFAFAPPAQHHQPMVSHHQMASHAPEMPQPICTQPTVSQAAPSYYLIPATGAIFSHPNPAISMMPPPSPLGGPPMGFAMPPPMQQAPHATLHQPQQVQMTPAAQYPTINQNLMTTSGAMEQQPSPPEIETPWPRGAVVKPSPKFTQPQKVPGKNMFRDEIIIRNADSGKIMGVKGRRVAVVEEISKTIISFQKVPQGVKERTLTITGNSEETIERAKLLIEETIRRNVSPSRPEGVEEGEMDVASGVLAEQELSMPESVPVSFEAAGNIENVAPSADGMSDLTGKAKEFFELTNDAGVLKLSCADPEMLAAAQDALNAYFKRTNPLRRSQGSQQSQTERQLKAERRKSMPSFSPEKGRKQSPNRGNQPCPPEEVLSWRRRDPPQMEENADGVRGMSDSPKGQQADKLTRTSSNKSFQKKQQQQGFAKSTPNLAGLEKHDKENQDAKDMEPKSHLQMRVLYTRDYLLQCTASPLSHISPGAVPRILREAPEILREIPGKFNGTEYKEQKLAAKVASQQPSVA